HWLLPAVITFTAASLGRIQIGERYILPIYPYLVLLLATSLAPLAASLRGRVLLGAVAALHAGPTLMALPGGTISYLNILAGGRAGAHPLLAGSNPACEQDPPRPSARRGKTWGAPTPPAS